MTPDLKILAQHNDSGQPYWFLGALSLIKLSSEQTGGQLSVIEDRLPAGRGTPYHVHRHDDETFYLLEGSATFFSGSESFQASAGATIFLPRNIPHGFRSDTPARILIVTTPGGFDQFVVEAAEPAGSLTLPPPSQPDFARLTAIAARYGIEILGPLPG